MSSQALFTMVALYCHCHYGVNESSRPYSSIWHISKPNAILMSPQAQALAPTLSWTASQTLTLTLASCTISPKFCTVPLEVLVLRHSKYAAVGCTRDTASMQL